MEAGAVFIDQGVEGDRGGGQFFPLAHISPDLADLFEGDVRNLGENFVGWLLAIVPQPGIDDIFHQGHFPVGPDAKTAGPHVIPEKVAESVLDGFLGVGIEGGAAGVVKFAHGIGEGLGPFLQKIGQPDLADPEEGLHTIDDQPPVGDEQFLLGGFDPGNQPPGIDTSGAGGFLGPVGFGGKLPHPVGAAVDLGKQVVDHFRLQNVHGAPFHQKPGDRLHPGVHGDKGARLADLDRVEPGLIELRHFNGGKGKVLGHGAQLLHPVGNCRFSCHAFSISNHKVDPGVAPGTLPSSYAGTPG